MDSDSRNEKDGNEVGRWKADLVGNMSLPLKVKWQI